MSDRTLICCLVLLASLSIVYLGQSIKEGLIGGKTDLTVEVKPDSIGWMEK
jgi:hypothetical protein